MVERGRHHARSLHSGEQTLGVDGASRSAGTSRGAPSSREQPVIAAAAGDLARVVARALGLDLEDQPRVIFEAAAELGGEGRIAEIDAARGD